MARLNLVIALRTALVTLILTGLAYPLVTTGVALVVFPRQAEGSLLSDEAGQVIGSALIAQPFARAAYLVPRPSAAGAQGFDGTASGGSNLGPTSKALRARVLEDVARLVRENPSAGGPVPAELVSASASGLDPHLSRGAALWQVSRIAQARGVSPERVRAVVELQLEPRDLFVLGEPRVNVLLVNLALDRQFGRALVE